MRRMLTVLSAILVWACTARACPEPPAYSVLRVEDTSQVGVLAVRVDVRLLEPLAVGPIASLACNEIEQRLRLRALHVFEFRVWELTREAGGEPGAVAVFAPGGDPARAAGLRPGDVRQHRLRVQLPDARPRLLSLDLDAPPPPEPPSLPPPRVTAAPAARPAPSAQPARLGAQQPPGTSEALALLERWRKAWEARDLEQYMQFYDADFRGDGKSRDAWRAQKQRVFERAGSIEVEVRKPQVELKGRWARVRFVQAYRSDTHSDLGTKTLELVAREGRWLIVAESWRAGAR